MDGVSRETLDRLDALAGLIRKWQASINLIGPKTLPDLWRRHFLDSAQLLPLVVQHRPGGAPAMWADMGAGAGFPGLILAIMGAGEVHLIESDARKCAFLRQAILLTGAPAQVHRGRLERIGPVAVDIVTARALAPLEALIAYGRRFCREEGEMWFLKGAEAQEELTRARQSWTFHVETFASRSDPRGRILRLRDIARVQPL